MKAISPPRVPRRVRVLCLEPLEARELLSVNPGLEAKDDAEQAAVQVAAQVGFQSPGLASSLLASSIPLSPTSWTPIGPAPIVNGWEGLAATGRIAALAAHPTDPNTIYVAAAGGGVWKTTNGGASWTPKTDSQVTTTMGAIAIAPSNPNVIYAGTGEANGSSDSYYGRGLLKSTDAGATWTLKGASQFDRRTIAKIVVDPTNANLVYVAVVGGSTNGLGFGTGILKSSNGGDTWTNTTSFSPSGYFSDLVLDPSAPQTLYAAVQGYFVESSNGDDVVRTYLDGVYKTTNGGASWALAGNFPTGSPLGRIALAISPSAPQTLLASVVNPSTGGLLMMLKTTNGGATWATLSGVPNYLGTQGRYDTTLAFDPLNANIIYAGGAAGLNSFIRSANGGASWSDISTGADSKGPHVNHHGIGFDANGKLLDGNDGGIWRLDNSTPSVVHWANLNGNLQITQFNGIALHPTNPDIAYGGSQGNGTVKFNGSLGWTQVDGGNGGFVRVDQTNPNTIYHSFEYKTGFLQRSDNSGVTWASKTSGINLSDSANFYPPFVMDPGNSSRLLLGTNRVYETTNRGESWTPISSPNTIDWSSNKKIDSLATAKTDSSTIYASAGGKIFVTVNNGVLWTERNISTVNDLISQLYVDPTNNMIAYAVRGAFGAGRHVFRTTDGGTNWINISSNLPDIPTNALTLNPNGPGTADDVLYVGTDAGVYESFNLGETWLVAASGFPHARVVELEYNSNLKILAAGTYGRGLWELSVPDPIFVISSTPAGGSTLDTFPTDFAVVFSAAYDASTVQASDLTVNGLAADSVVQTDSVTLTFHYSASPVTASGLQTMAIAGGAILRSDNAASSQDFNATFQFIPPLSLGNVSRTEGNSGTTNFVFTVTLPVASDLQVTVAFATQDGTATTADNDYQATSGTLTFAPGATSKTITITSVGDTTAELDETFQVVLSSPLNATLGTSAGVGTILNDDFPELGITNVSQLEGNSGTTPFVFTVTISQPSPTEVLIPYLTSNGTATTADNDYQATSGTLTFAAGSAASQQVTVLVQGDTVLEVDEDFLLALIQPPNAVLGGSNGQAIGTIFNDDGPQILFGQSQVSHLEGNSGLTLFLFTVNLNVGSAIPVTVEYATLDGTATTAGNDYQATSGTLTFSPGQTSKDIFVLANGDTTFESHENFTLALSHVTNAFTPQSNALGTIQNDDPVPAAEIVVEGLGQNIAQGDTAPSLSDGTNFGVAVEGTAALQRTFTVRNTGTATLSLGALSLPFGYTITEPLVASIAVGGFDDFTLRLSTATLGTFLGSVRFANNDADHGDGVESPFTFAITGTVNAPSIWYNRSLPLDVNHDGKAAPIDALLVINRLLLTGSGPVPTSNLIPPQFFYDTSGDGNVSPLDALRIINRLNSPPQVTLNTLMPYSIDVTPRLEIVASSPVALLDGTQVKLDVDFNGNGDFNDPGEVNYYVTTLFNGKSDFALSPALPPSSPSGGPYTIKLRAHVTDADGVEGYSPVESLIIDTETSNALKNYVQTPDPAYQFSLARTVVDPSGLFTLYVLDMTSQTWRSSSEVDKPVWRHWVEVLVPSGPIASTALLLISGGNNNYGEPPSTFASADYGPVLTQMAVQLRSVFINLKTIPSEPLTFSGETFSRTEDNIIAYSFDKFLRNIGQPGNDTWPVLLAMVKSAVRAMDTVQAFVPTVTNNSPINDFLVTGYSKRGWTTWLTAAVDNRVKAIIPGVIDVLNISVQMAHHYGAYGFFSEAIQEYSDLNVFARLPTPEGEKLSEIIDPYRYLNNGRFTIPKLLINSSGDEFFASDSAQYYFDDLPGQQNYLRYLANTSHSLDSRVFASTLTFYDAILNQRELPKFSWKVQPDGAIRVQTVTAPTQVLLWQATNPESRDFRRLATPGVVWTSSPLINEGGGVYTGNTPLPTDGATAYFVELTFPSVFSPAVPFVFTTEIRVKTKLPLIAWLSNSGSPAALPASKASASSSTNEIAFALAVQPVNLASSDEQVVAASGGPPAPVDTVAVVRSPGTAMAPVTWGSVSPSVFLASDSETDPALVDAVFGSQLSDLLA